METRMEITRLGYRELWILFTIEARGLGRGGMRVCLMIEGQEDVTWQNWCDLADACEASGVEGLFRSDHYLSVQGHRERGSLDAWTTLAGLAARTSRIRLGTMVSPATFRHPSMLAKSVVTVDHISGGRAELGLGAGWNEDEHRAYGFEFSTTAQRMEVLAEQLAIVHGSWTQDPFDYQGHHYTIEGLNALPKPVQKPHPNLIVGGSAGPLSARLAALWADEYNTVYADPEECTRRRSAVENAWESEGRDPKKLVFSLMTGFIVGRDQGDLIRRAERTMEASNETGDARQWLAGLGEEFVVGTPAQIVDKLGRFGAAGVDRIMLQHQLHSDVDMVGLLGEVFRQIDSN
jgi:F420-dependent oxidoreductase-like protein